MLWFFACIIAAPVVVIHVVGDGGGGVVVVARTIKILQSLCASHKIVKTYRNQHAPRFEERKTGTERKLAALPSLI
jgi:hypothetical protein